jgi:hypothetical protein
VTERALMTIDDVIEDFGAAGHTLPRASMQWALDSWAPAAPRFLELLSRYVDGIDTSKSTADALFHRPFVGRKSGDWRIRGSVPLVTGQGCESGLR